MTPAVMAFSMSTGAATLGAVCIILAVMPPLSLGVVFTLVNLPVIATAVVAIILRKVR